MIDSQARLRPYFRLMALVALLGVVSAIVTFVFIVLENQGIDLTWGQAELALGLDARLFTVGVCTIGGLSGMLAAFITNPFGGALLGLEPAQGGRTGTNKG